MTFGAGEILEEFSEASESGQKGEWLGDDGFVVFTPFELRRQTTYRERMKDPYYAAGYRIKTRERYKNNPEYAASCRLRAREQYKDPEYAASCRLRAREQYRNDPEFAANSRFRARKWREEALQDPIKKVALQKYQREWARENAKKPGKQEEILKRQRIRHRKTREGIKPQGPAKLDKAQVLEIRTRVAGGESNRTLAAVFGVNLTTIWKIVKRLTWKNI